MTYRTLLVDKHTPSLATLWLNRPEKNNAFDHLMIAELKQALAELATDESLRLLLLRGKGKHFSAGADLTWMKSSAELSYEENRKDAQKLAQLMADLASFPAPTLAVVQGAAFGGALGLISCCDMAIGADNALFSLSEVRLGIAPAVISPYLVHAMGARTVRRYALSGERFDALNAQRSGLLAEVYPLNELETAVAQWSTNFMLNATNAMRATKALLQHIDTSLPTTELRSLTEATIASLRTSTEGQAGLQAFFDKRPPYWQEKQ